MRGIVLREQDNRIRKAAKRLQLSTEVREDGSTPFDRTLFIRPGLNKVPWELLNVGFEFLDKWEAAAPIWRYDTLAVDVAKGEDRKRTEALMRDLRVPLYAHELLFVRPDTPGGKALLETWQEEEASGGEPRLAFLRALYRVKPLFLALPRSWLGQDRERHISHMVARPRAATRRSRGETADVLVKVRVGPGRYVNCKPDEVDQVQEQWQRQRMTRRERRLGREA